MRSSGNPQAKPLPNVISFVDFRRASRFFDLARLEHRRNEIAAGRLSLHDGPTVSTRSAARTDRFPHQVSLYVCSHDLRQPQLDDSQRGGAVHPDDRTRVFRDPAGHAVLADAGGGGNGRPRRPQLRLARGPYLLLLSRPHEGLGARLGFSPWKYPRWRRGVG